MNPTSQTGIVPQRGLLAFTLCCAAALLGILGFAANRADATAGRVTTSTAGSTGPGWSTVAAPYPPGSGELESVTCLGAAQCWAVGSYSDTARHPLIEEWIGASWSIVPIPVYQSTGSGFSGVTCASSSNCWAVGYYTNNGVRQTFIEQWNGSMWSIVSSPNTSSAQANTLWSVTCVIASNCWAVGNSSDGANNHTLIEHWDGNVWSIIPSPDAPGQTSSILQSVTCEGASQCWAVGYYLTNGNYLTLIERWNGSSWSVVSSPNVSGSFSNLLFGVTCFSASQCWAVGRYLSGSHDQTLIEQWNGVSWSIASSFNTSTTQDNSLLSVACDSQTGQCWAVGDANGQTLTEHWNGSGWSIIGSPNVPNEPNFLQGVTCVSATDCWAVGSAGQQTLVEVSGFGNTWSIVQSPSHIPESELNGVACASPAQCWAVGDYNDGNEYQMIIERWNGSAWSMVSPPSNNGQGGLLADVTCTSASQCWSVGYYFNGSVYQTLIEQWNGSSWAIVMSPDATTTRDNLLKGVICASTSQCWAVGYYFNGSHDQTLIEQWNGSTWSIFPSPNTGLDSILMGVSCASTSQCWAVGFYNSGGNDLTLIEQWNGSSWSIVPSPNQPAPSVSFLAGVTCPSTVQCWAVGYSYNDPDYQTLIEQWNGSSWSIVAPPGIGASNEAVRVACTSTSNCWGVGYSGYYNYEQTLAEHWDGSTWSIVSSPDPGASGNNRLNGVTCTSSAQCWAVGSYSNGTTDQPLIELYSPSIPPLTSAVSTMSHGSAGVFNVNLPLTGTRGVECRNGNGNYSIVFTFVNDVTDCGSAGSASGSVINGPNTNQCTENLTGVPNAQYTTVSLSGVLDSENNTGDLSVPMGVLIGDVNGSGRVDAADVSLVRQQTLQTITTSNFREDINVSGRVDAADVSLVRQKTLTSLPSPP